MKTLKSINYAPFIKYADYDINTNEFYCKGADVNYKLHKVILYDKENGMPYKANNVREAERKYKNELSGVFLVFKLNRSKTKYSLMKVVSW